jgi:hypothetical protein
MILKNLLVNSSFAAFASLALPVAVWRLFGSLWLVRRILRR